MEIKYTTKGVCAQEIIIEVEDDIVKNVKFIDGCTGNGLGINALVTGMRINEVIQKLDGIKCGRKQTSCPDQLVKALKEYY